jgi:integrase
VQIELKYIWRPKAKGREYTYYRRDGQRFRIHGVPGSAEFLAYYQQIHARFELPPEAAPVAKPGSLKALIADYKTTQKFTKRKPKTKKSYLHYLTLLEDSYGRLPVATLTRPAIILLRDKFDEHPRTANFIVQILSILMEHAIDRGLRETNPAAGIDDLETGPGHRPWEEEEIARYRKQWLLGTVERTAFELALNTGQRGGDCATMQRSHIKDGVISVVQLKTGNRVWIPISNDLRVALDAWDARQNAWIERRLSQKKPRPVPIDVQKMILTGEKGRAFSEGTFGHLLNDAFKKVEGLTIGLENRGVTPHGLRFTAATRLRELGCSWEMIASITGHDTAEMVRKYANQKRDAELAINALNTGTAAQTSNESVKPTD